MHRLPFPRPFFLLLAGTAVLFTWQLSVSGFANAYYSAAAQAGAMSWKALLFGSLDPGNGITVDKPPLGLWPMAFSVRLFGLNSWSLLLPQAVEGVASVALLYGCVYRTTRRVGPAVLAGTVFALTPVSVLMFRYNNPDAVLTLVLLTAAYALLRSLESDNPLRWLILAGSMAGLGFLAKMLEAFLVLPALSITYLVFGSGPVLRRLGRVLAGGLAALVAGGWWVALVTLWPAADRPFVGGSPVNSVLQLALGYNGVARITGAAQTSATGTGLAATNLARIGRTDLAGEISWFMPAALILAGLSWWLSGRTAAPGRVRAGLILWGTWIILAAAIFAAMAGIFHSYYTVILAPAIAALLGIGVWTVWENRSLPAVRRWALVAVLATAVLAGALVLATDRAAWAFAALATSLGAWTATLLNHRFGEPVPGRITAGSAIIAGLLVPATFGLATITSPHNGPNPMAGPGHGAPTSGLTVWTNRRTADDHTNGFRPVSPAVIDTIRSGSQGYRWAAAAVGARSAAAYQLTLGEPVLAIGGYQGSDPAPTLAQFIHLAGTGQVHWFVPGGVTGPSANQILDWARAHFVPKVVDGISLYEVG